MQATQIPLKYLFTAVFEDGTVIEQTPEDKSAIDTEGKRSQFFDVLEKEKESQLLSFSLTGAGHTYEVDLRDGSFAIDDVKFKMIEGELPFYRLVFFRRHTHSFNQKVQSGETTEVRHDIVYRMGWQCTMDDKNFQRVMEFE